MNLKNENINKNNELENLKQLINNTKNIKNQKSINKIIENYIKENEELKK